MAVIDELTPAGMLAGAALTNVRYAVRWPITRCQNEGRLSISAVDCSTETPYSLAAASRFVSRLRH